MADERYVFPALFEGFEKGLGPAFTDGTRAELKRAGLDMQKLPPAIPAAAVEGYVRIIARHAFPTLSAEQQLRELGKAMLRGWQKGLLGAASAAMLRLIGPRRTLQRLDRAISTVNNFAHASTEFVGEQEALVTIEDVQGLPTYWQGILEGGLELLGVTGTVTVDALEGASARLRAKWD